MVKKKGAKKLRKSNFIPKIIAVYAIQIFYRPNDGSTLEYTRSN